MSSGTGSPTAPRSDLPKLNAVPIREALSRRGSRNFLGMTPDGAIRTFFGANATVSIVVLLLIMVFLLKEGVDFVPLERFNLSLYRQAGLEYVDHIRSQVDDFNSLNRRLQKIREHEATSLFDRQLPLEQVNATLAPFDAWAATFSGAIEGHEALLSDLSDTATSIKQEASDNRDRVNDRARFLREGKPDEAAKIEVRQVDFLKETQPLRESFPAYRDLNVKLASTLNDLLAQPEPALALPADRALMADLKGKIASYAAGFPAVEQAMVGWYPLKPVPWYKSLTEFFFGADWITASFWQDWYGVLPLFFGSLSVSIVALVLAIPLAIGAAIYVNQIATPRERAFIKPYIEFVAAIPSVVLGFFGVVVLGSFLRDDLSRLPWLSWVPGFPMAERLNIFTAGCLLALMAIPTIFTLAEDALNNVPKAFVEASTALGATRFQTIVQVMFPAALSGVISAVLLGFGRVIGETMVVLLCAGGRIAIPDFLHNGLGAFFQPAHTMTGIIAQEMGEVSKGTLHYRALFMIGILLFLISLGINYMAQKFVHRYKVSIG